ncbi:12951_t:CDS:2, partial [Gigaspora margarita]
KNKRETSLGTALMLVSQLQQYIHNIDKIPCTGVLVDLFLPYNTKVRIISTYIPSKNKELSQNTQKKVLEWVKQAKRKNMLVITIRDFNNNITRKKYKNQIPLLGNLLKNNVLNDMEKEQVSCQIDNIWISAEVIHEFMKPELWEADGITDSDHVILKTSWRINLRAKLQRKKKTIRKCYQYDKTSEEDWTKFRNFISEKIVEN